MNPQNETVPKLLAEAANDVAFGVALLALGIFSLAYIITTPAGFIRSTNPIGFDTVPIICSSSLIALSAIYLVERVANLRAVRRSGGIFRFRVTAPGRVFLQRIATVAALVAYVFALKGVPFFIATFGLLALMFPVYGQRSIWRIVAVSLLGSAALTGLFIHVLRLPV